jgi:small subunit ribosomal protein S16
MVKIRLRRIGRKKAPVYRLVVADSKSPRDGKFIEIIGQYAPRLAGGEGGLNVQADRALYWLSVGAQPSDTARSLLRKAGCSRPATRPASPPSCRPARCPWPRHRPRPTRRRRPTRAPRRKA